jgi:hypothetical protein
MTGTSARAEIRNLIETEPAVVNGREIPDTQVVAAARALGLMEAAPAPAGRFSALVVLSGLVSACVNRTRHAARLVEEGLDAGSVVALGAHRELGGKEPTQARELGLGQWFDEADVLIAATRQAFGIGDIGIEQPISRLPKWNNSLWSESAHYRWPGGEIVIAASGQPGSRRADTTDQLRRWASLKGIGAHDRVLLVTTQIYVPLQQLGALRVLGLERGCSVHSCGVDRKNSFLPRGEFGGRRYLQEIRSALQAGQALLATAQQNGH